MDPKLASNLRLSLSATAQLVGGLWLYGEFVANIQGLNLGLFGYIFGAWTAIALLVLLHDLIICYALFNREGMQDKLWTVERMNEKVKDLFFIELCALFILGLPVLLWRISKGL